MADAVGPRPPGSADKSLGEIVADVTSKIQLLVREEIELAKAEVSIKAKQLGTGIGMASPRSSRCCSSRSSCSSASPSC